jgi:cell division GTPase FtsZ
MVRDRKSDIAQLVSDLDVAFILTGLNGTTGKGATSVVAETLGELGVFTVAITPDRRDVEALRSLRQLVDVVFEVPYDVLIDEARATRRNRWKELISAAVGQICRVVTFSLATPGSTGIDTNELRAVLRGEHTSVVGYGDGDGIEGCLAAFEAASASPFLGPDRDRASRGVMVFIEAKPGVLQHKDAHAIRDKMSEIASDGARLHFSAFENEHLSAEYRVTILSRS